MTLAGTGRQGPDPKISNDEWVSAFLTDVSEGLQPYIAAELHGVHRTTLWKWFRLGGHPASIEHPDWTAPEQASEPYGSFVQRTLQAEAGFVAEVTKTVSQKAKTDAEFGLKVLKSRRPDDWSATRKNTPTVLVQDPTSGVLLSYEDWSRIRAEQHEGEANDDA